jgi:hypothetical protein
LFFLMSGARRAVSSAMRASNCAVVLGRQRRPSSDSSFCAAGERPLEQQQIGYVQ